MPSVRPAGTRPATPVPWPRAARPSVTPAIAGTWPIALRTASSADQVGQTRLRHWPRRSQRASCASASTATPTAREPCRGRPAAAGSTRCSPGSAGSDRPDRRMRTRTCAAARSSPTACRTSARSKNRSAPRSWNGTPAWASDCSSPWVCAFVRTSTAISAGRRPALEQRACICLATAAASAGSSGYSVSCGAGPGGPLGDERRAVIRPGHARRTRCDQGVGQRYHLRRGPVVADQPDHRCRRVLGREARSGKTAWRR